MRLRLLPGFLLISALALAQQTHSVGVDEFDTEIQHSMEASRATNDAIVASERLALPSPADTRPKIRISKKARGEYEKGTQALQQHNFPTAEGEFNAAIADQADYAAAHLNLGVTEMNLQNNDRAKREFEAAIKIDPQLDLAFQNLGVLEIRRGHIAAAETDLKSANRIAPKDLKTLTLLAYAQVLNHEYDKAITTAERVHVAKEHAQYAFAHMIAGSALQATGRTREAIAEYKLFVKENPNDPRAESARNAVRELSNKTAADIR
jgi:tetratricopeptide (TPR) repeat protein